MRRRWRAALATVAICAACGLGQGMFMMPEQVPIDRVVRNIEAYRKEHPGDSQAYFLLARVNYLAVAVKSGTVGVFRNRAGDKSQLPQVAPNWMHYPDAKVAPPSNEVLARHVAAAVENYRKAIEMDDTKPEYHLGLASVLEAAPADVAMSLGGFPPGDDGAKRDVPAADRSAAEALMVKLDDPSATVRSEAVAGLRRLGSAGVRVGLEKLPGASAETREAVVQLVDAYWRDASLAPYAEAYRRAVAQDEKQAQRPIAGLRELVSYEAATHYVAIVAAREKTPAEQATADEMRETLKRLDALPMGAITPVILSLPGGPKTLAQAELPAARVRFDIDGTGRGQAWSWVTPNAGLLVWDPKRDGKVTSGRQLFGNVTFGMIFRDGYQALECLDDDRDGYLRGEELKGLAVWFDRNSDGVSQPGEVVPVEQLGIRALATHPNGRDGPVLTNVAGLELNGGAVRPTWDWVAKTR